MNESKSTYATVFDGSSNVNGRFIKHIFERSVYGKIAQTKYKNEAEERPSYTSSYSDCIKMIVE
jgi:hypothetical protein